MLNKNSETDKEIDISKLQEGGNQYTRNDLNNIDFNIINFDENVKVKIKNYDNFAIEMKEYIYLNGLVQANKAEYIESEENDGKLILKFKLNNPEETILTVKIDEDTFNFSDNYLE